MAIVQLLSVTRLGTNGDSAHYPSATAARPSQDAPLRQTEDISRAVGMCKQRPEYERRDAGHAGAVIKLSNAELWSSATNNGDIQRGKRLPRDFGRAPPAFVFCAGFF